MWESLSERGVEAEIACIGTNNTHNNKKKELRTLENPVLFQSFMIEYSETIDLLWNKGYYSGVMKSTARKAL